MKKYVLEMAATARITDYPPDFVRLPGEKTRCPRTGLSRRTINELILPNERNQFRPKVRSYVLRQPGSQRGIRLIDYASLRAYITGNQTEVKGA